MCKYGKKRKKEEEERSENFFYIISGGAIKCPVLQRVSLSLRLAGYLEEPWNMDSMSECESTSQGGGGEVPHLMAMPV